MSINRVGVGIVVINTHVIFSRATIITYSTTGFWNIINRWIIIIIIRRIIAVIIIVIVGIEGNSCICIRIIERRIRIIERRAVIIIRVITISEIK
jgi:hypothetical protein